MLILIEGPWGSGKNVLTTIIAEEVGEEYLVLSNYELKLPNYRALTISDLMNLEEKPTLVILDEGYWWLESRASGSMVNKHLSYVMFESRKLKKHFLVTAQMAGSIDIRFRKMAQLYIRCKRLQRGFKYEVYKVKQKKGKIRTMEDMEVVLKKTREFVILNEVAERYYQYYDTLEVVTSGVGKQVKVMERNEKIQLRDRVIQLMKDNGERGRDLYSIKNFLFEKGFDLSLAELVLWKFKANGG